MNYRLKNHSWKKHRKRNNTYLICWLIIPFIITILLALDGLGIYIFTTERLIVLGAGLLVMLLPFFSEITIKNFSIKKDST